MIKAILFDVDGVLVNFEFNQWYRDFATAVQIDPEIVVEYHRLHMRSILLGSLLFVHFEDAMRSSGAHGNIREAWIKTGLGIATVNKELLDVVEHAHKHYRVGILSNISEARYPVDEILDFYKLFDYVNLSFRDGLIKPDEDYYSLALSRMGVQPTETIFIDNTIRMVEGAVNVGMHGIVFKNNEDLKTDLALLGVHI